VGFAVCFLIAGYFEPDRMEFGRWDTAGVVYGAGIFMAVGSTLLFYQKLGGFV
jgi:hypothetical protein